MRKKGNKKQEEKSRLDISIITSHINVTLFFLQKRDWHCKF